MFVIPPALAVLEQKAKNRWNWQLSHQLADIQQIKTNTHMKFIGAKINFNRSLFHLFIILFENRAILTESKNQCFILFHISRYEGLIETHQTQISPQEQNHRSK